jgi:hypothetical protein
VRFGGAELELGRRSAAALGGAAAYAGGVPGGFGGGLDPSGKVPRTPLVPCGGGDTGGCRPRSSWRSCRPGRARGVSGARGYGCVRGAFGGGGGGGGDDARAAAKTLGRAATGLKDARGGGAVGPTYVAGVAVPRTDRAPGGCSRAAPGCGGGRTRVCSWPATRSSGAATPRRSAR